MKKTKKKPKIPSFRHFVRSSANDNGRPPEWIEELRREVHKSWMAKKKDYRKIFGRKKTLEKEIKRTFLFGPIEFPLDVFVSSRWHEVRASSVPLPKTREDWELVWKWWRTAESYMKIKEHIERYNMIRPIHADWYVNFDPDEGKLWHRCFSYNCANFDFPFMILRTGNERILMAMFEWGWETIPALIHVRDCGYSPLVTELLRGLRDVLPRYKRGVNRPITERGIIE